MEKGNQDICSYEEEKRALILGIGNMPLNTVTFATDSLSLLEAIKNKSEDTIITRQRLQAMKVAQLNLLYVPGHKDIPGNELADLAAKAAAKLQSDADQSVPLRTAKTVIKREIRDAPPTHRLTSQYYTGVKLERDREETENRRQGATLAQLRSGHHRKLGYYQKKTDRTGQELGYCKRCDLKELDDVEHWLMDCPHGPAVRQEIFGTHLVNVMELATSPRRIIRLAERTLTPQ